MTFCLLIFNVHVRKKFWEDEKYEMDFGMIVSKFPLENMREGSEAEFFF